MSNFFNFEKITESLKTFWERANQEQPDIFEAFFQKVSNPRQTPLIILTAEAQRAQSQEKTAK